MSPVLYSETRGAGPELVLVHGWGLSSRVWEPVLDALTADFRVRLIDLPGHGRNRHVVAPERLEELAALLSAAATPGAVWVGWSLGGLAALQAALDNAAAVQGLVLCATTPRFLTGADWPHGMSGTVLSRFAGDLTVDYRRTVTRFLALQVQGDDFARAVLRRLRASVMQDESPSVTGLQAGLEILRRSDLRTRLGQIDRPVLVISGGRDRLTPPAAAAFLAAKLRYGSRYVIAGAAHAPFLSHPDEFSAEVRRFALRAVPLPGRAL